MKRTKKLLLLAVITHSNSEFVVDFIRVMPGVPKAKVKSRIILTPQHALFALEKGRLKSLQLSLFCHLSFVGLDLFQ